MDEEIDADAAGEIVFREVEREFEGLGEGFDVAGEAEGGGGGRRGGVARWMG